MGRNFFDLAFTPSVKAEQERFGSRSSYARVEAHAPAGVDTLSAQETSFIEARDSFYLATISETGWPYVQHRGGPMGFVKVTDAATISWAELTGNRQYISTGNAAADDRAAMIMVDYPHRRRLKIMGHMHIINPVKRPELVPLLAVDGGYAIERIVTVTVAAFDWNCPQHITPRYTLAEIEALTAPLHRRIAELEAAIGETSPLEKPRS